MRKFIFDDTGTGKTKRAIELVEQENPNRVLIVCPANVIPTWEAQIDKWATSKTWRVYAGKAAKLKTYLDRWGNMFKSWDGDDTPNTLMAFIVSYDSAKRVFKYLKNTDGRLMVVFDESHYLKNPGSQRSQVGRKISMMATHVLMLTGTPVPKDLEDIFGQCKVLYPSKDNRVRHFGMGFGTLHDFRVQYGTDHTKWINGRAIVDWTYSDASTVSVASLVSKDVMPIRVAEIKPPKPEWSAPVVPSKHEVEVYDRWMDDWSYDDGNTQVVAGTATERAIKKAQLDDGFLYDSKVETVWFGLSKLRAAARLADELYEYEHPVIIWTRYRATYLKLAEKDTCCPLGVFLNQSSAAQKKWSRKYHALIASVHASGTGVDGLQKWSHVQIWVDLPWTGADFHQANSRLARLGQERKVRTIIMDTGLNRAMYEVVCKRLELDDMVRMKQGKEA